MTAIRLFFLKSRNTLLGWILPKIHILCRGSQWKMRYHDSWHLVWTVEIIWPEGTKAEDGLYVKMTRPDGSEYSTGLQKLHPGNSMALEFCADVEYGKLSREIHPRVTAEPPSRVGAITVNNPGTMAFFEDEDPETKKET